MFRIDDHLARMRRGADLLQLPMPDADELAAIVEECLRRNGLPLSVVRLTLSRGVDVGRGLNAPAALDPSVVVRVTPWPGPPSTLPLGRTLVTSSLARNDRSPLSSVKSLSYVDGVVARLEAQRAGADDALMCNTRGLVTGATSSNVFAVIGDVLADASGRGRCAARHIEAHAAGGGGTPGRRLRGAVADASGRGRRGRGAAIERGAGACAGCVGGRVTVTFGRAGPADAAVG